MKSDLEVALGAIGAAKVEATDAERTRIITLMAHHLFDPGGECSRRPELTVGIKFCLGLIVSKRHAIFSGARHEGGVPLINAVAPKDGA